MKDSNVYGISINPESLTEEHKSQQKQLDFSRSANILGLGLLLYLPKKIVSNGRFRAILSFSHFHLFSQCG